MDNRKYNIFYIRLTVIIVIAYMLFFQPELIRYQYWGYFYVAMYLLSNILIFRLPSRYYFKSYFYYGLVFFDTGMITLGIFLSSQRDDKYFALVESINSPVYLVDATGQYLSVNDTLAEELQASKTEINGRRFSDFHSPEEDAQFMKHVKDVFASGTSRMFEAYNLKLDKWTLRTLSPLRDRETDRVQAVSVVSKDTTERVKAEQELRRAYERPQPSKIS